MPELSGLSFTPRNSARTVRVLRLAERQGGVVSWGQLADSGASRAWVCRELAAGRLHRVHPGVYALGHRALATWGRLNAALLYGGSEAALSHTTAAWWWGVIGTEPTRFHLAAPGDRRSLPEVCVHHPRGLETTLHRGVRVTTVARTLVDLAAILPFHRVRLAVAEADHRGLLRPDEVGAVLRRGRPGSAALRAAVARHLPELARTRSPLEVEFLLLCERYGVPIPEVNVRVEGYLVDALWREQRVVAELDGASTHGRPAAVRADRERELRLRRAGYVLVRYSRDQVEGEPAAVADDALATLAARPAYPGTGASGSSASASSMSDSENSRSLSSPFR